VKITTKVVGSSFTAQKVTTYSGPKTDADWKLVFDELPKRTADSRHPFLDFLDALEADARQELRRHGLPEEVAGYCKTPAGWVRPDERPRSGVRICALETVIREAGYAHDTGPGYAVRMLRLIADVKGSGVDPVILNRAFDLGDLVKESKIKFLLKRRSRPGGMSRGKKNAERNVEMAQEFNARRHSSHLGAVELAAKISAEWARKNKAKSLGKSAAYAAVQEGNKILSGVHRKPDE
jgi:hypothetical protein